MKRFVTKSVLKGTCYHEFFKGKWDGETFWREDSIYLHDDELFRDAVFYEAVRKVIPAYDIYGETEIAGQQWELIRQNVDAGGGSELFLEADEWLREVFQQHGCFTILGI